MHDLCAVYHTYRLAFIYIYIYIYSMAEQSGGSLTLCVKSREPVSNPDAPSCNRCVASQQQAKKCVVCSQLIDPPVRHCVHCGSDQNNPRLCINPRCQRPLFPSVKLCYHCSMLQSQVIHVWNKNTVCTILTIF